MTNKLKILIKPCVLFYFGLQLMVFLPVAHAAHYQAMAGQVSVIPIDNDTAADYYFNGHKVLKQTIDGRVQLVVGIPLTDSNKELFISKYDGRISQDVIKLSISEKKYPEERITIKDKNKVNPKPRDIKRITKERALLEKTFANWDEVAIEDIYLQQPVAGRVSSAFGFRRIINGKPKSPHRGVDFAAVTGTPIKAAQKGRVTLVADLFYTGKTVVVDHGQGWQTIYCHLNKTSVVEGEQVTKSSNIGTVGQTGRATGPHLHFGVILNQARVDPSNFWNFEN